MPTIITRTIGPTGRDYASFTLAEADVTNIGTSGDLVANDEAIVFEADAGDYSENLPIFTNGALTCDATRNVTWTHAAGAEHGGQFESGVNIIGSITVQESFVIVDGLSASPSSGLAGQIASGVEGVIFRNLMAYSTNNNGIRLSKGGTATNPCVVENCAVKADTTRTIDVRAEGSGVDSHWRIVNCSVIATGFNQTFVTGLSSSDTLYLELTNNLAIADRAFYDFGNATLALSGSDNVGENGSFAFPVAQQAGSQTWTLTTDTAAASTGSQVVYDATTLAMVNVPGNDAIGVGTATGAPTTDVRGDDRIRGTYVDPGAFTTELVTFNKTIGPSGRDYATFTAAEADVQNIPTNPNLQQRNEAIVFEADAGTYTESVTFQSSLTTDATRNVTYKPAAGSEHGGDVAAGVVLHGSQQPRDNFTALSGIVFAANSTGYAHAAVNMSNTAFAYVGISFNACLFVADLAGTGYGIKSFRSSGSTSSGTAAAPVVLQNCAFHNIGIHAISLGGPGGTATINDYVEVLNCTFVSEKPGSNSTAIGIFDCNGSLNLKIVNCLNLGIDNDSAVGQVSTLAVTTTGSVGNFGRQSLTQWQFPGKGSPYPITPTTNTSPGAGDWAIYDSATGALVNVPDNDVIGAGTATGAPTTDINGDDRIRGTFADPGAFTTDLRTITATVGPSGRDYTALALAEADVENIGTSTNLQQRNEAIVFEADAGTYSGQFTVESTLVCDATRNVTYKPAAGSEHGGDKDSGVILTHTGLALYLRDDFTRVEGLVCKSTSTNNTITTPTITGWVLDSCIVVDDSATGQTVTFSCTGSPDASNPVVIQNCLVMAAGSRGLAIFGTGGYARWSNNTVLHTGSEQTYRSHDTTLTLEAYNNFGVGGNGVNLSTATVTGAGNISGSGGQWATGISAGNQTWTATTDTAAASTGSQVIYDATTGALVNVSGNDAVGGGTATGAPATDINGNDRIRGVYADPGAFTTELVTFNKTIGATGRDYTTFTLAEADVTNISTDPNLQQRNEAIVFEADAGTYAEILNVDSTLVSDHTRNVTYRCADRTDRPVVGDGTQATTIRMRDDFTHFDGIDAFDTTGGAYKLFASQVGLIVENCVCTSDGAGVYLAKSGANIGSADAPIIVRNVVTKARFGVNASGADLFVEVFNCTFLPGTTSPAGQVNYQFQATGSSDCKLFNCIVLDSRADRQFQATAAVTGSNNIGVTGGSSVRLFSTNGVGSELTPTTSTSPGAGDWAIYDATTGALVNVPGNDAVGAGTATGAPTTDINGDDRIRGTFADPGAFTTELVTINKTIGPSGRDYTTFTAAEADVTNIPTDPNLQQRNEAIVFEADAGTYSESVTFSSSLTTDATRQVTYKPAAGSEHGGDRTAGVIVDPSSGSALTANDAFTKVEGLVGLNRVSLNEDGCVADRCIVVETSGDACVVNGPAGTSAAPVVFKNCVIESSTSRYGIQFYVGAAGRPIFAEVLNCTFINNGPVIYDPSNNGPVTLALVNNLVLGGQQLDFNDIGGYGVVTGSNNFGVRTSTYQFPVAIQGSPYPITATTDTTAASTGSQAIYDATTRALVNVPGNDLVGAGTATGAPTTDINGEDRIRGIYADPGAFTTELATINKTIGATGRDYTTFTAAEADVENIPTDSNLQQRNEAIVFEADAGTYSEAVTFSSSLTTDATRNITYRPAAGSEHGGVFGDGAHITSSSFTINAQATDKFTRFEGLSVAGSASYVVILRGEGQTVSACLVENTSGGIGDTALFATGAASATNPAVVENSVLKAARGLYSFATAANSYVAATNNTIISQVSGSHAVQLVDGNGFTNTLSLDNTVAIALNVFAGSGSITGSNNFGPATNPFPAALQAGGQTWTFTTDTTAASTGSQVIYDDETGRLYDVDGNDAWHFLTDLTGVPATDIEGETRLATGYNPGAFELTGSLGAVVLLTTAAASLAALGTSTFSGTAALAAPYEFAGTAGTLFSGTAALTTRTLESSGNAVQLFFGSSALEVQTAFGGSGESIITSAGALALSPIEAASTGLSLFSTQIDLTFGWAGVIRDDGLVRGGGNMFVAATRFGGRNVDLPPHTGYMALALPQISLIAEARLRAGQEEVRMHAAQVSFAAQGGMINLPEHSRGAGTVIQY